MGERQHVQPALGAGNEVTQEQVVAHLRQWQVDTDATRAAVAELRQQVDAASRQLESPKAALEYLDFFDGFFAHVSATLATILAALEAQPPAFEPAHAETLRQLAANASAESRRTVAFRDKWVNKPLPYEQTRPMLTRIASEVRDQLLDYGDLTVAAARLAVLNPPPPAPPPPEGLGRRELLSRLVRPLGDAVDPTAGG